jgi:hypothetical protein
MLVVEVQPRALKSRECRRLSPLPGFEDIQKITIFFFYEAASKRENCNSIPLEP